MAITAGNYIPVSGRLFRSLTGWAGDASFTTTPATGDQIEYPDSLTVASDGVVTGADGNYTLRHVRATGSTEAISYSVEGAPAPGTGATATGLYDAPAGKTDVALATGFDPYIFQQWATQPGVGEQIVFTDSELAIDSLANLSTDNIGVFDVWFVALDGATTALSVDTTGLSDGSVVVTGEGLWRELFRDPTEELFTELFR